MCGYGRQCQSTEEQLDDMFDNCPDHLRVVCNNGRPIYDEDKYLWKSQQEEEKEDIYGSEMRYISDKVRLMKK